MSTIKGVWIWNDELIIDNSAEWEQVVSFDAFDASWDGIQMYSLATMYYNKYPAELGQSQTVYAGGVGWVYGDFNPSRIIDFGTEPQEVSDEFYAFLTANATYQEPKTLKGKWYWKESIDFSALKSYTEQSVNFTSDGMTYISLGLHPQEAYIFYGFLNGTQTQYDAPKYQDGTWSESTYRTIDFGTEPQEVSDEFYAFLTANATYQEPAAYINGVWKWNETIALTTELTEFVSFTSNGTEWDIITTIGGVLVYYRGIEASVSTYVNGIGWVVDEEYRTLNFGTSPKEVSEDFYNFLMANATYQPTVAEKLVLIAENEPKVYEAGYAKGNTEGYQNGYDDGNAEGVKEGIAEGKQAEYDAFWDIFQDNGKRTDYQYGFAGQRWTTDIFKPKYDMKPSRCDYMFAVSAGLRDVDLVEHLSKLGVVLDISNATMINYMCHYAYFKRIGILDTRKSTALTSMFYQSKLVTIDKIILKDDGTQTFKIAFGGASQLTNITFEGVIGQDIDFQYSTSLTAESIINILNHLSTITRDKTLTLSQTAVDNAEWDRIVMTAHNSVPKYGKIISSTPIELKAGERLKVELIVDDEHFFGTANHDENDTHYWAVGLQWDNSANNREYTYTATADENHNVNVVVNRFDTIQDSPYITFVVRAVKIDDNGNEISENLYNIVDDDFRHYTTFEEFIDQHPDWSITLN